MKRYIEVYKIMLRNSLIREMNFAVNFWLWLLTEFLWFMAQVGLVHVVFSFTDAIYGWNKWHVVVLIGTHQLTSQLFTAFFFMNLANLSELIRTGKLDFLLLQPVNSQFIVSSKQFGFDNLINALVGVVFIIFGCYKLALVPSIGQVFAFCVTVIFSVVIHYAFSFSLVSISFWFVRAQGMIYGYYSIMNMARYPDVVWARAHIALRAVLSIVIPVIVVANVPTRTLLGLTTGPSLLWSTGCLIGAAIGILIFSNRFWKFALRHYTSAS